MPKANPTKNSAAVRRHVPPRPRASAHPSAPTIPQISGSILTSFTPDRPFSRGGEPTGTRQRSGSAPAGSQSTSRTSAERRQVERRAKARRAIDSRRSQGCFVLLVLPRAQRSIEECLSVGSATATAGPRSSRMTRERERMLLAPWPPQPISPGLPRRGTNDVGTRE
jgi:hypothetical protein